MILDVPNVADLTAQSPAERSGGLRRSAGATGRNPRETPRPAFRSIWWSPKWICCRGSASISHADQPSSRQIWGFTLPYSRRRKGATRRQRIAACAQELGAPDAAAGSGLHYPVTGSYTIPKPRQRLYTFPREFAALGEPLLRLLNKDLPIQIRCHALNNTLRGVFFTAPRRCSRPTPWPTS